MGLRVGTAVGGQLNQPKRPHPAPYTSVLLLLVETVRESRDSDSDVWLLDARCTPTLVEVAVVAVAASRVTCCLDSAAAGPVVAVRELKSKPAPSRQPTAPRAISSTRGKDHLVAAAEELVGLRMRLSSSPSGACAVGSVAPYAECIAAWAASNLPVWCGGVWGRGRGDGEAARLARSGGVPLDTPPWPPRRAPREARNRSPYLQDLDGEATSPSATICRRRGCRPKLEARGRGLSEQAPPPSAPRMECIGSA